MVVLPAVFRPRGYPGAAGPSPAGVLAHPRRIGPTLRTGSGRRRTVPDYCGTVADHSSTRTVSGAFVTVDDR
jgi:hypothetical protein